jgi:hypothetical protein
LFFCISGQGGVVVQHDSQSLLLVFYYGSGVASRMAIAQQGVSCITQGWVEGSMDHHEAALLLKN